MTEKLIMIMGGVKIIARIESENENEKARLETVSAIVRNAFQPKREKGEE